MMALKGAASTFFAIPRSEAMRNLILADTAKSADPALCSE
jgi:hypothetical protein